MFSQVDNLDRMLLQQLQINSRQSTESLGAKIGLSATACQRRIKKLRGLGVIKEEVAILNPANLDNYITVLVDIQLNRGGAKAIDAFKLAMKHNSAVQQCYYLTGDIDFSLIICAANIADYEELTRQLFLNNENIAKFTSRVSMDNVKTSLKIPL
jgi:Lrp/AsnC family leucine-responsive transcriptional regulator